MPDDAQPASASPSAPDESRSGSRHEYVVDDEFARRFTTATLGHTLTAGALPWIILGGVALMFGLPYVTGRTPNWGTVLIAVVVVLLFPVLLVWRSRGVARDLPPGSVLWTRFDSAGFTLGRPRGAVSVDYASLTRPKIYGDFVFFRHATTRQTHTYPRALFPDAELARFS